MRKLASLTCFILIAGSFALAAPLAFAAPGGGSSGGNSGGNTGGNSGGSNTTGSNSQSTSPKKLKCKRGEVSRLVTVKGVKKRKCVKAAAGIMPQQELYEQGNALALEGEYDWALDVLELADQSDPNVLNMQGYSHRKAGRLDVAMGFYKRAIDMNPDFVRAREYLGEGYAAAGQIELAKMQLAEIEKRCGVTCEEYLDLSKAISAATN